MLRTRGDGHRGDAAMRQRKPFGELAGGLVRARAVERHHRRRHARASAQLGPPPVADGRDLDVVHAPANGLFETMNGHVCSDPVKVRKRRRSYAVVTTDQAKGGAKATTGSVRAPRTFLNSPENYFWCPVLHSFCTEHPQDFHNGAMPRCDCWEVQLWNS